ncbi:MAG TPA: hypothetical protein VGQ59_17705, partial [Cyclobacteriaceae bacterium]|nr:hypothetical protein [Cyclobacteriaceae bacterium]
VSESGYTTADASLKKATHSIQAFVPNEKLQQVIEKISGHPEMYNPARGLVLFPMYDPELRDKGYTVAALGDKIATTPEGKSIWTSGDFTGRVNLISNPEEAVYYLATNSMFNEGESVVIFENKITDQLASYLSEKLNNPGTIENIYVANTNKLAENLNKYVVSGKLPVSFNIENPNGFNFFKEEYYAQSAFESDLPIIAEAINNSQKKSNSETIEA